MKIDLLEQLQNNPELPTLPGSAYQIMQMALDPEVSLNEMANVIMKDVALSTRILKVVNSSYFSLANDISSISQAVVILGLNMVKNIALSLTVMDSLQTYLDKENYQFLINRSINMAVTAQAIANETKICPGEDAFLVGLLQELGLLMLAHLAPELFVELNEEAKERSIDITTTIRETIHVDTNEYGWEIAKQWGLPENVVKAIKYHSSVEKAIEDKVPNENIGLIKVGYLSALAAEIFTGWGKSLNISKFKDGYEKYLGKTNEDAEDMLNKLSDLITNAASGYQINIPATKDFTQILQDANSELGKLNFKYEQMYRELMEKNIEISEKNETLAKLTKELDVKNKKLEELATKDGLTGIFNHRFFQDTLKYQFSQALRGFYPLSLILFDIDHFKKFNDTYGHQFGDIVLRELSQLIMKLKRKADLFARYGGEEFVMILTHTDIKGAAVAAEKIRRVVEKHEISNNEGVTVTINISLGVSEFHPQMKERKELIELADQALYKSKETGRNKVTALRKS